MMATAQQELERFTRFVQHRLSAGEGEASLDELFDLWRHENPSDELYAQNVAAIAASIEDFKRGDRGTIAGEHSAELRRQFGSADK
jgi:hypothetical protein